MIKIIICALNPPLLLAFHLLTLSAGDDDTENVETDRHEDAVPGAELSRGHLGGTDHAEALCAGEMGRRGMLIGLQETTVGARRTTIVLCVARMMTVFAWA